MELFAAIVERWVKWLNLDLWEVGLIFGVGLFTWVMYALHKSSETDFRFEDFFCTEGKADCTKLVGFGAFLAHTFITLRQATFGALTLEYMALYSLIWTSAYVGGIIAQAFAKKLER